MFGYVLGNSIWKIVFWEWEWDWGMWWMFVYVLGKLFWFYFGDKIMFGYVLGETIFTVDVKSITFLLDCKEKFNFNNIFYI